MRYSLERTRWGADSNEEEAVDQRRNAATKGTKKRSGNIDIGSL